jgi:hypothetical protein
MIKMKVKKMEKKDGNKETTLTKKIKKDIFQKTLTCLRTLPTINCLLTLPVLLG